MFRASIRTIGDIFRLDQLVHDTPFGNVELKQVGLVDSGCGLELIFLEHQAVQGLVFAQGATVDPAVGEDKIVVGHQAGTFEWFLRG